MDLRIRKIIPFPETSLGKVLRCELVKRYEKYDAT